MGALIGDTPSLAVSKHDTALSRSSQDSSHKRHSCWWSSHSSKPRYNSFFDNNVAGLPYDTASHIYSGAAFIGSFTWNKDLGKDINLNRHPLQRDLLGQCSNNSVTMYAECGELDKANASVQLNKSKDAITWTTLIAGYARSGQGRIALDCFEQMLCENIIPSASTYVYVLNACASIKAIDRGEQIHDKIVSQGLLENSIILGNALVDMYAKCGALSKARKVLDELPFRDIVSWNSLIAGYAQEGEAELALTCLEQMKNHEGILPDVVTYICVLKACAAIKAIEKGRQLHEEIANRGLLQKNVMVGNALVNMYAKCGAVCEAQGVLNNIPSRNVVSWNTLIAAYADKGEAHEALDCFQKMKGEGISPNSVTFTCILKAFTVTKAIDMGRQFHDEIIKQGMLQTSISLGGALLDLYAKCGYMLEAWQIFEELPSRDVVSWSALIAGYANEGQPLEALDCLGQMQHEGIRPNAITYVSALIACATIRDATRGKQIHDEITRQGLLHNNVALGCALVDMYAKCGNVSEAHGVLKDLPSRNVITWNALISGYSQCGHAKQAINCLQEMEREGVLPDAESYACVLNVCGHQGLVKEGQEIFRNMNTKYGVRPSKQCYTSMIDLFGRAGHLEKAAILIQEMACPDDAIWHALLGASQRWGDVDVGEWAFEHAMRIDKHDVWAYIFMANIYAEAGMEEKAQSM